MRAWDRSYNRETHETWQVWWWSMVAHNCHGKTKNFMAKTKTSRQNKKPPGKNKTPHSKRKIALFCRGYLLLLWGTGIWFLLWSIWFCREVFGFAVRYLFLPWGFWFCRPVTVVGHHSGLIHPAVNCCCPNLTAHTEFQDSSGLISWNSVPEHYTIGTSLWFRLT